MRKKNCPISGWRSAGLGDCLLISAEWETEIYFIFVEEQMSWSFTSYVDSLPAFPKWIIRRIPSFLKICFGNTEVFNQNPSTETYLFLSAPPNHAGYSLSGVSLQCSAHHASLFSVVYNAVFYYCTTLKRWIKAFAHLWLFMNLAKISFSLWCARLLSGELSASYILQATVEMTALARPPQCKKWSFEK